MRAAFTPVGVEQERANVPPRAGKRSSVPAVKRVVSWLWDWRLGAGLVVGFLLGVLFFCEPWHLRPAWGDTPTWLLVLFAGVAGAVGLVQLNLLRQQVAAGADEADARAITERRRLVEDVEVHWAGVATGSVLNGSRRPISAITSKVMSLANAHVLAVPDNAGVLVGVPVPGTAYQFADSKPGAEWDRLRPGDRCGFTFPGLQRDPDQILVAWFTDDAGFRWQLDEYLRLVRAAADDEYVP